MKNLEGEQCLKERIMLVSLEANIDKSGKNAFANYDYFKGDVLLITVKPLLAEHRIFFHFNPEELENGKTKYFLRLEDYDSNDFVSYDMTVDQISLKGTNEVQNKGAQRTYCFRYLLMAALGVANDEDDPDSHAPQEKPEKPSQSAPKKENKEPEQKEEETTKSDPKDVHLCEECKKEIIPTRSNTVLEVIDIGKQKYGKQLCSTCIRKHNEEAKKAVEAGKKEEIKKTQESAVKQEEQSDVH